MSNDKMIDVLEEMLKWIKASSYSNIEQMMKKVLPDNRSRVIYQMTDGKHKIEEIKKSAKVGQKAIAELHARCLSVGFMQKNDAGRPVRLFDLADFDLLPTEPDGDEDN